MRDGSVTDPGRRCGACGGPLPGADPRRRYCSGACRMRAHRRRRELGARARSVGSAAGTPRRVYECPGCGERQVDERRCLECNLFCRALGAGGECPGCGEPVLVAELAGQAAHTAGVRPPGSGGLAVGSATSAGGRVPTGGGISMSPQRHRRVGATPRPGTQLGAGSPDPPLGAHTRIPWPLRHHVPPILGHPRELHRAESGAT